MTIKSKSGVSGRCRKPVTMPETYLEFFTLTETSLRSVLNAPRCDYARRDGATARAETVVS